MFQTVFILSEEISMNSMNLFDGRAMVYNQGRPSYPQSLIDELYTHYGVSCDSIIADIGSGTGKLTKLLLDKGSTVYSLQEGDEYFNDYIAALEKLFDKYAVNGLVKMNNKTDAYIGC